MKPALLLAVSFAALSAMLASATPPPKQSSSDHRVYELRMYTTNEGKMSDLHKRFRDHTNRLFHKHGITIVGFWEPMDEKDGKGNKLIYMVSFPSREAATAAWKEFSADPEWQRVFKESHKNGVLVKKVESIFMEPTDYSPLK